jgi:GNAT superfamily N-acetyltransferase
MGQASVGPMSAHSVDAVATMCAAAFGSADDDVVRRRWRKRIAYLLATDPEGSFVGERAGRVLGVAQAVRREGLWSLSLLVVDPSAQSEGLGRSLFQAALGYGDDEPGLIVSSNDFRALRLYASAGFSLRPAFQARGRVDRRRLPGPHAGVIAADESDLEQLDVIARGVRGAGYGAELRYVLEQGARLISFDGRGFAVAQSGLGVWMLVASDEAAACSLLWAALDIAGPAERPVRWIPGFQDWAVAVALQAGLEVSAYGALCVRGDPGPLRPFLPSEPFA